MFSPLVIMTIGIVLVIFLIMGLRVNAFIALMILEDLVWTAEDGRTDGRPVDF